MSTLNFRSRFPSAPTWAALPAAFAALAIVALLSGCGAGGRSPRGDADAATEAQPPVRLAASDLGIAAWSDLTAGIPVSGTLTPMVDVKISAPLAEALEKVEVREGQAVRRGQVLARFRTASLEPQAVSASAALKMRAADRERMTHLFKEGAVAERDLEDAETAWRAASAEEAQAAKKLQDATVRAPIDGVIASRAVESGDRVAEGDPLFELVNTAQLELEATLPSEFVQFVKPGAPVTLAISGFAAPVEGTVARVNAAADPATRQVKVYVTVANPQGALVGGMFATGALMTRRAPHVIATPIPALRHDGANEYELVVERGRLARRSVRSGVRDEARGLVEIVAGLAAGDTVVSGPIEGLTVGRNVIAAGVDQVP